MGFKEREKEEEEDKAPLGRTGILLNPFTCLHSLGGIMFLKGPSKRIYEKENHHLRKPVNMCERICGRLMYSLG